MCYTCVSLSPHPLCIKSACSPSSVPVHLCLLSICSSISPSDSLPDVFFYPVFDPDFCLCLIPLLCLLRWLISCVPNLSSVKTFCLLNWTVLSWHLGPDLVCQTLSQRICWPALSTAFVPGRAHTSTKAQQSPLKLVSPNPISNETQLFMVYYNLMWNQIKIKIIPNYGTLFFIKTHVLFPKKLTKLSESTLSHNVNENEKKKNPGSTPEDNGVYSVPRPILHPSY